MRTKREYPERPMIGVGALIHKEGKILLVKRKFEPNKGRWSLPGGLMEVGEDPGEGAKREVKEELGIDVEVEGLFHVANEVIRDEEGKVKYHFVLVDYLMAPVGGQTIKLNDESEEYRWFEPQAVEGLDVSKNTVIIAKKYIQTVREQSLR